MVNNINETPVILSENNVSADTLRFDAYENETLQICLNISDPDNDVISISGLYSITGLGNLSVNENTTCFDYRSADGFIGTEVLLSIVCDNGSPSLCDTVVIIMNVRPQFIFSQVISPNGDGLNDVWIIGGLERFPNNEVTVFNRWGNIVYKAKGYDNVNTVWGGEQNSGQNLTNNLVPDGTYFYIIELGNESKLTGFVVLKH